MHEEGSSSLSYMIEISVYINWVIIRLLAVQVFYIYYINFTSFILKSCTKEGIGDEESGSVCIKD
jgi:hypothetical protein